MSLTREQIIENLDNIFTSCVKYTISEDINTKKEISRDKLEEAFISNSVSSIFVGYTIARQGISNLTGTEESFLDEVFQEWLDHAVEKFNSGGYENDV